MDAAAIGAALSGSSARTGSRFIAEGHVPVYIVRGKKYVRESEFQTWIESQKIEATVQQTSNLKAMLESISARVMNERSRKAS
jgi:hypothetical protein